MVRASVEQELLPDAESGELPPYFTTSRSFFCTRIDFVEDILRESPQEWI